MISLSNQPFLSRDTIFNLQKRITEDLEKTFENLRGLKGLRAYNFKKNAPTSNNKKIQ